MNQLAQIHFAMQSTADGSTVIRLSEDDTYFRRKMVIPSRQSNTSSDSPSSRRNVLFWATLPAFAALLLNASTLTGLRFTAGALNTWAFAALFFLPAVALAIGIPFRRRAARVTARFILWPLAVITAVVGALAAIMPLIDITGSASESEQPTQRISTGRYSIAVYEMGGATSEINWTHFYQECKLMPGLQLVRQVQQDPNVRSPTVNVAAPDTVVLDGKIVPLHPFLWPLCRD